ncbi:hypothetical protein BDB01DRAFT_725241 [Pilobolus umbonatus]|nr:hypothetical protein BDB01DRAFT_725241 [Pilobolus umbonatus]
MKHLYWIALLIPLLLSYTVIGDRSVDDYLSEGSAYLTSGKYNEALVEFDAAIAQEPQNYLSYFKRATAHLSLGRNQAAIDDFNTILSLKPDFDTALLQRSRLYSKEGEYDLATKDVQAYLKRHPKHGEAKKLSQSIELGQSNYKQAQKDEVLKNYDKCITHASTCIRLSPSFIEPRLIRARCHLAKGKTEEAVSDYVHAVRLSPANSKLLILLARLKYFSLDEPKGAMVYVKQCLHYDPEAEECKELFRKMKKINKEIEGIVKDIGLKKYTTAHNHLIGTNNRKGILADIDREMEALESGIKGKVQFKRLQLRCYQLACQLYGEQKERDEEQINKWCSMVLDIEDDISALIYRGELLLNRQDYSAAIRDLEKANELSQGRDQRVILLLNKAHQKLKLAKKKDYYKILDISPNADLKEIKKAYRKKAHEWHPDKYSGDLSKEEVEHRMSEINQAYEVLSDPDMRQQYDNGQDPYDTNMPNSGNPFQSSQGGTFQFPHGFPFGGSFYGNGQPFNMHFEYH